MDASAAAVPSVEASSTTMIRSTIARHRGDHGPDELFLVVRGNDDEDTAALEHERVLYTAFMKVAPAIAALCLAAAPAATAPSCCPRSRSTCARRGTSPPAPTSTGRDGSAPARGLVRVRDTTAYFTADVETIIGDTLRTFDANQANYHLEAGLRQRVGRGAATLFFHHVSRHYVDRAKTQAVDWNILGATDRVADPVRAPSRPRHRVARPHHRRLRSSATGGKRSPRSTPSPRASDPRRCSGAPACAW